MLLLLIYLLISITASKELATGDLVCGQYVSRSSLYWKLLLPTGARGMLHITCMLRSQPSAETGKAMPVTPKTSHAVLSINWMPSQDVLQKLRRTMNTHRTVKAVRVMLMRATEDEHIPVGYDEDVPASEPPSRIFFISTDVSDVRASFSYMQYHLTRQLVHAPSLDRLRSATH